MEVLRICGTIRVSGATNSASQPQCGRNTFPVVLCQRTNISNSSSSSSSRGRSRGASANAGVCSGYTNASTQRQRGALSPSLPQGSEGEAPRSKGRAPGVPRAADGESIRQKSGAELREEFFLAAATGKERGLPEGAFLNDNVVDGPMVDITWEPYGDTCAAPEGSSLLKAAVDAGALTIDNRFCLTGQCDVCIVEIEGGEVVRSCMKPVPTGQSQITCLVLDTDDAWDAMMV